MRYCHRIFSRNPLRSCLGPWTHTRVTFIPFFRFKAVEPNTSPSLSVPLLTKFGRQAGIVVGFGCGSSFISFEDRTFIIRAQLWKNLNYPGGIYFFFLPLFSPFSPPNFSRFIVGKLEIRIGRDFWLIFTISVHDPGWWRSVLCNIVFTVSVYCLVGGTNAAACLIFR